jgi:hypothetical protein
METSRTRLTLAACLLASSLLSTPALAQLLQLEDFLAVPASAASPPLARINFLREAPDGSGRLFVNDLRGALYVIDGDAPSTYLDLGLVFSPHFKSAPDIATGFVSFALHPEFASNGRLYTVHTEFVNGTPNLVPPKAIPIVQHVVLSEFTATTPSSNVFSGTRRELMRIASPHTSHNTQEVAFNPRAGPGDPDYGLLYVANGEYGATAAGDPDQLQRLDTVYGALLRIDPLGGPFMRGATAYDYGIPPDNPWVDGDPDTLDEIWAHGFRNSHRLTWDPESGALFAADIGQDHREEINRIRPGANYGWPFREGNLALDPFTDLGAVFPLPPDDGMFGYTYPVAQYTHEDGVAIAGAVAYRGSTIPALDGRLLFGDIVTGRLWSAAIDDLETADDGDPSTLAPLSDVTIEYEGEQTTLLEIVRGALNAPATSRTDLRLHVDQAGEPFLTTKQDGIIRTLPEPGTPLQRLAALLSLLTARRLRTKPRRATLPSGSR